MLHENAIDFVFDVSDAHTGFGQFGHDVDILPAVLPVHGGVKAEQAEIGVAKHANELNQCNSILVQVKQRRANNATPVKVVDLKAIGRQRESVDEASAGLIQKAFSTGSFRNRQGKKRRHTSHN